MVRLFLALALALVALAPPAAGRAAPACSRASLPCPAAIYLSADGDDANPGTTPTAPWRTLARVNAEALQPGDRVMLAGGQEFAAPLRLDAQDRGEPGRPIVVTSYGEGRAAIVADSGNGIVVENTQGVTVRGLDVWTTEPYHGPGSGIAIVTDLPGDVKLAGVTIRDIGITGFDE